MKKLILSSLVVLTAFFAQAQMDVTLKLNHKLGIEDFAYDMVATNNLGQMYKAERLEYYVSQLTIVHDGGMETAVPLDVVALVQPGTEIATSIILGNYDVTSIEKVKFYIGVHEPVNNEDPSLYPSGHPLAPKSPSMHWGWASGYRFIAYEGVGGTDFSQGFAMHGLGNENYFEVEAEVDVETVGSTLVMNLNGNYIEGLRNIDLSSGVISHGSTGAAKEVLENWRDYVFGNYYVGIEESEAAVNSWSVYPNPTSGAFTISLNEGNTVNSINVTNVLGEIVQTVSVNGQQSIDLRIADKGIYFLTAISNDNSILSTEKIIIK